MGRTRDRRPVRGGAADRPLTAQSRYELVQERDAIASTWKNVPDTERQVLELRFLYDLTQREIGDRIGYSQMHVSRMPRRALSRLETAAAAA
jgi:RNA polymerase sigma-B factor